MRRIASPSFIGIALVAIAVLPAQSPDSTDWQAKAGGKASFEVASVKPATRFSIPTFPLNPGNAKPRGGRFSATFPLWTYVAFAYKLSNLEVQRRVALEQTPKWVAADRFEIEARAAGNPTKDQMRLMMQSLLAERFRLEVHFETRKVPVFALMLAKPGKLGPNLRPHADGPPCPNDFALPGPGTLTKSGDVFPTYCGSDQMSQRKQLRRIGYRDATMPLIAESIAAYGAMAGELDKPVVDRTGLEGQFDFNIEYAPGEGDRFGRPGPPNPDPPPDPQGASFVSAVREQLGLKLVSTKGSIRLLMIDRVEMPSEN